MTRVRRCGPPTQWRRRWVPVAPGRCRRPSPASPSTAAPSARARRSSPSRAIIVTAMISCRGPAARAALAVVGRIGRANTAARCAAAVVPDVLAGLRDLAARGAPSHGCEDRGVTGSVGKTGDQGSAAARAVATTARPMPRPPPINNHWGVPLSLARCPAIGTLCGVRDGHESCRRDRAAGRAWSRPHVAIITTIAPVHLEFFGSLAKIADAKAEIFLGVEPGGAAVLNRDNRLFHAAAPTGRRSRHHARSCRSANIRKPMRA